MFVNAIEKVTKFTRPFMSIYRVYGEKEVKPSCATFIIVNNDGWVLTCKHVAEQIVTSDRANQQYSAFRSELSTLSKSGKHYKSQVRDLEKKYNYVKNKNILIQQQIRFMDVVDNSTGYQCFLHKNYDIALIHFEGFNKVLCDEFPVFAKDSLGLKQGKSFCRLGYPYPEFNNFKYDESTDEIEWTDKGRNVTPLFPIDGILTRFGADEKGNIYEIELSTPGLKGQSGGPLFDENGVVYGLQSRTLFQHLGFDIEEAEIVVNGKNKKIDNYPFMHLGRCVHINVIKAFMNENGVKYQVG